MTELEIKSKQVGKMATKLLAVEKEILNYAHVTQEVQDLGRYVERSLPALTHI